MDLIVLAKEPLPGRVKTRLTPPCDPVTAAALAEAALADTLSAAMASGADRVILALEGSPGPWCPPGVEVVPQGQGSLARRLATAWTATAGPALQIGMDTPQVDGALLSSSMSAIDQDPAAAVLGLSADGGWWALGLRRPCPDAFDGVPMSSPDTGRRQLAQLRRLGLRVATLPVLRDVDRWADAVAVAQEQPESSFASAVGAARGAVG